MDLQVVVVLVAADPVVAHQGVPLADLQEGRQAGAPVASLVAPAADFLADRPVGFLLPGVVQAAVRVAAVDRAPRQEPRCPVDCRPVAVAALVVKMGTVARDRQQVAAAPRVVRLVGAAVAQAVAAEGRQVPAVRVARR